MKLNKDCIGKNFIVKIRHGSPIEIEVLSISNQNKYVRFKYSYTDRYGLEPLGDVQVKDIIKKPEQNVKY